MRHFGFPNDHKVNAVLWPRFKKSSIMLNKLKSALHHAMQPTEDETVLSAEREQVTEMGGRSAGDIRRSLVGSNRGNKSWKCYFNAVTCF